MTVLIWSGHGIADRQEKLTHQGGTDSCSATLLWGVPRKNRAALLVLHFQRPVLYR